MTMEHTTVCLKTGCLLKVILEQQQDLFGEIFFIAKTESFFWGGILVAKPMETRRKALASLKRKATRAIGGLM